MPRRAGAPSRLLGLPVGPQFGCRSAVKKLDRDFVPHRRRHSLLASHPPRVSPSDLETAASGSRPAHRAARGRTVAYSGYGSQPSLLCLHPAQRAGRVSRLPVVFLRQRAASPLSEFALPARLQYGSAALLLGGAPALAVPLERLSSGASPAQLPADEPGRTNPPARLVLGRLRPGLLHSVHHPGVLLDALLPGPGIAAGLCYGRGRRMDTARNPCAGEYCRGRGAADDHPPHPYPSPARTRRHRPCTQPEARDLSSFARPHEGSHLPVSGVSAVPAGCGLAGLPGGVSRHRQSAGNTRVPGRRLDDGFIFSRGAAGPGDL